jgi:hypothetical protein
VGKSLLDVLREVVVDPAESAALAELGVTDYLARHGYEDVDPDDLREAVNLAADALPPDIAQVLADASQPVSGGDQASEGLATDDDAGDHSLVAFGAGSETGDAEQDAPIDSEDADHGTGADADTDGTDLAFDAEPSFDIDQPVTGGLGIEDDLDETESLGDDLYEDSTTEGPGPAELNDIGSF